MDHGLGACAVHAGREPAPRTEPVEDRAAHGRRPGIELDRQQPRGKAGGGGGRPRDHRGERQQRHRGRGGLQRVFGGAFVEHPSEDDQQVQGVREVGQPGAPLGIGGDVRGTPDRGREH